MEARQLRMKTVTVTANSLIVRSLPRAEPATDTKARLTRGQAVTAHGESFDGVWLYIASPPGWVSAEYVEEYAPLIVAPRARPPAGLAAIKKMFGEPGNPRCTIGRVKLPGPLPLSWEPKTLVSTIACHELIAEPLQNALNEIKAAGLWSLMKDFGGCFNYRKQRGGGKISTHAWAISLDFNTKENPLGAVPKMDRRIVAIFEKHGFEWGGRWSRPDGMHFQYATAY